MMNILAFSFCRLGDTLAMLPALHLLRSRWPDASIFLLSQEEGNAQFVGARGILEGRGVVDDFFAFPVDGGWISRQAARLRLAWRLRRIGVDIGIVMIPPAPPLTMPLVRNMRLFLRVAGARRIVAPNQPLRVGAHERFPKAADELLALLAQLGLEVPPPDGGDFSLPSYTVHANVAENLVRQFPAGRIPVALAVGEIGLRSVGRWNGLCNWQKCCRMRDVI